MTEKKYTHVGWIPCINGHLDFGLIKPGIVGGFTNRDVVDSKTTLVNFPYEGFSDSHTRKIMMQSKVDWKDNQNSENTGLFRVFVLGTVTKSEDLDQRTLQGNIYVYPANLEPNAERRKYEERFKLIHESKNKLEENSEGVKEQLNENYTKLETALNELSKNHQVSYRIQPDGIIYLKFIDKKNSLDDKYEQYLITRQVYFYLKYSLHEHKHHDNQMDALMTIVSIEKGEISKIEGLKLLGQLKRELTSIKRTFSLGDKNDGAEPQGIISYMSTLNRVLKSNITSFNDYYEREQVYIDALKASFNVQSNRFDKYQETISKVDTAYRAYTTMTLTVISIGLYFFVKPFIQISEGNLTSFELTFFEAMFIFISIMLAEFVVLKELKKDKITDELTNDGFKKWVEKWYIDDPKSHMRKDIKQIISMWVVVVIFIFILSYFDIFA